MRIGIYTPYLDTLTGGELYLLSIAECLSNKNDVEIFWDDESILEKASRRFKLNLDKVSIKKNIFSGKFSALQKINKTISYDRVIFLSDGSIPTLLPGKLILHFQQPIKKEKVPLFEKIKVHQARKIICNSFYTKEFIDKAYGVKSVVLYPPAQKIDLGSVKKKNIILTVGRYQSYGTNNDFKKIGFMMEMFKKIHSDYKDWEFHIVTSIRKGDEEEFKKNIEDRVNGSIKIIKNADFKMIEEEYKHAKIYWHAAGFGEDLENFPERAEHFGMSTVEAMSAGCVPVVVNLGGQKEIVEDKVCGFLWDLEDEFMANTIKLITDNSLWSEMSKKAVVRSGAFGKENFGKEIRQIINS